MIDPKPLLFANFLAIMLLVTAGFATIQRSPELIGAEKPDPNAVPAGQTPIVERSAQKKPESQSPKSAGNERAEPRFDPRPVIVQTQPPRSAPETKSNAEPPPPEPKVANLTLRSNVYGDRVLIDGQKRGSTAMDVELEPGTYEIEVRKQGHSTWRRQIAVDAGDDQTLMARLERYTTVEYRNGTWKHGVKTGEGTYRDKEGLRYEGDFKDGEFHGEGTAHFPDGRVYEGEWKDSEMHGEGKLQLTNGDVYEGHFRNNQFSGRGTLTASNGDTFTGNWEDGELNGHGTMTTSEGMMYVGDFRDGDLHGKGTLTYPDGGTYKGEFANNLYHGHGVRTYASGRRYEGEFVEGRFHGQGEIRHPSGATIESTFREGEPYGEVTLTTPAGEVFTARTSEPGVCYRKNSYRATECPPMEGW